MKKKYFNYGKFVDRVCIDPEKKNTIEAYHKKFHILRSGSIEEHPFYKENLSKFNCDIDFIVSPNVNMSKEELDFLVRLIFGSLSSSYILILDETWKRNPIGVPKAHIGIIANSKEGNQSEMLCNLSQKQIKRLLDIYVNEQIELFLLWKENNKAYNWLEDYRNIGMVVGSEDVDSWRVKQMMKIGYERYEKQMEYIMADIEYYRRDPKRNHVMFMDKTI